MPNFYEKGIVLPNDKSSVFISSVSSASSLLTALNSQRVCITICACLNLNHETIIQFGISDSKIVSGISLNRIERDEVRLAWDRVASEKIFPRLNHKYAAIYFVPVIAQKTFKQLEDEFIVEVHLKPQVNTLYSLREGAGRCYVRSEGANMEMTQEDIRYLAVQRKMKAHWKTIEGLLDDIRKLKTSDN